MKSRGGVRGGLLLFTLLGGGLAAEPEASAQVPDRPRPRRTAPSLSRAELALLAALAADPVTAPFPYSTTVRGGKVVLVGRVATKAVHDAAMRDATALGITIDDQLVIDTSAAYTVAAGQGSNLAPFAGPFPTATTSQGVAARPGAAGAYPPLSTTAPAAGPPYVYPPPLFGYYDEPFYGFQPPLISYPPWWGPVSARRLDPRLNGGPAHEEPLARPPDPAPPTASAAPAPPAPTGTVEMTIDATGRATLRGTVPTLSDRIAVGQEIAQQPGVTDVLNLLEVLPAAAAGSRDTPPPPPSPADDPRNLRIDPNAPPRIPAVREAIPRGARDDIKVDAGGLAARLARAFERRPGLAGLKIRGAVRDGVATLTGRVPSALEAMLAFRAAQQTPGIRAVEDRLEFQVPEIGGKNPLLEQGRPEDVEPYLEFQVRRQFGDQVHIDRVRLNGDMLEIRGTVPALQDRPRVEATLRSMPILRGFRVKAEFLPE